LLNAANVFENLESKAVISTFARWIVAQKRQKNADLLYVVGVTGTIGRGKSTFCQSLVPVLNTLLTSKEGQALTRSLDDYYLPKAKRYSPEFLARGYNPIGISNRGPAGTHELALLKAEMDAFKNSTTSSALELVSFDKQSDDRAAGGISVKGRVGVLLLEGWFVGATTEVAVEGMPDGLKKSVALSLVHYKPFFDSLDALWAYKPVPVDIIIKNRIEQQKTLDRLSGRTGMSAEQIERFVRYFYVDAWEPGRDSPDPLNKNVSFWADVDDAHRFTSVESGGRALSRCVSN
jgi:pantothenate kinase-related protein Tda10